MFKRSDISYAVYYLPTDTYPTWMRNRLINLLRDHETEEEIIQELGLEDCHRTVTKPGDVFPEVQADLEWIYVVGTNEPAQIQIFRTSCPYGPGPDFVFPVWFSYVQNFPDDTQAIMVEVQRTAEMTLSAIGAYHKAVNPTKEE